MKFKLQKLMSAALIVMMLLLICHLSPNAEALPETNGECDIVDCARDVKELYHKTIGLDENRDNSELLNRNYESNIAYNVILDHIAAHDDELRYHFSGAYIGDDGFLVVMLSCDTDSCKDYIVAELECDDVVFEDGTGSYYEGQRELDLINENIAALQNKIVSGENVSDNAASLMQLQPRTSYNCDSNTVSVIFNMSQDVEKAFMKAQDLKDGTLDVCTNQLSETEKAALDEYTNAIRLFKSEISESDTIEYTVCSGYEQVVEETEAWRPGRWIWVYNNPDAGLGSSLSTGYRAKYTYNGKTYYGFVTCAHGTKVGNSVYIKNSTGSANKLGTILNRSYGGKVDVSFIRITNSNYTNGNAVYYTSTQPGVTRPGTLLDGTQTTVAAGAHIYKSGQKTYLTDGYVQNTNTSHYYNGIYFYDMIKADRAMTGSGDSGAVTYIVNGATIYGKAVGIVRGRDNGQSVFIKASNIKSVFGAVAY